MFTVVICTKNIIKDIEKKYHAYFSSLVDENKMTFCQWNPEGETLADALPELKSIISGKKDWQAVVVNDEQVWGSEQTEKTNPFDFVGTKAMPNSFESAEDIFQYRDYVDSSVSFALRNPLVKLGLWFYGSPVTALPTQAYLKNLDGIELGSKEYFKILEKLSVTPKKAEIDYNCALKYRKIEETFGIEKEIFNSPLNFIAIAERVSSADKYKFNNMWKNRSEFEYSNFTFDNLYASNFRYLLFDLPKLKGMQEKSRYIDFLTTVLIVATNEVPGGTLRQDRVYNIDLKIDSDRLKNTVNNYISRLSATVAEIDTKCKSIEARSKQPVDNETSRMEFESKVNIPINLFVEEQKDNYMAKYNKLGLSRDCPQEEYDYWYNQYYRINKDFIRFLRTPRRAVKTATKGSFKSSSKIDDERALRLNEYQREDVLYALEEEERKMINTSTPKIFSSEQYYEKMREADREIRKGIFQRMTKKKTLFVGLFAAIAYFIGFLPLIFSNFNVTKSFTFSLLVTGVVLGIFLVVGLVYLLVLRKRLINRFKHFNYVMSGIFKEIENGVEAFSKYLGHACNVMRSFSVLNQTENSYKKKQYILLNHKRIICDKVQEISEIFSSYIDVKDIRISYDAQPYDFDFTLMYDYEYLIPVTQRNKDVDFLQEGNKITLPVDYVDAVTLTREELYDW